jgi:threonine aldolase
MTGTSFRSDNVAPVASEIMDAMAAVNSGPAPSYGNDDLTTRVEEIFGEIFEHPVRVHPVATGTAANCLALERLVAPGGTILCHDDAHILNTEEGAPATFIPGSVCVGVGGAFGRIDAAALDSALDRLSSPANAALSLTQATEWGTVYGLDQVSRLAGAARERGLRVHMDGARFAGAVAALGCTPAEASWRAGIDVLSLGASKNGALNAEAVVYFDPTLADGAFPGRKRTGHMYSKMRFLSAQLEAYLRDGLWLRFAARANAAAARLADGLAEIPGITLAAPCEANLVFAEMPEAVSAALAADGFVFAAWHGGAATRLVPSFATTDAEVDALIAAARRHAGS